MCRERLASSIASALVGALEDLAALEPFKVWEGVIARSVEGERLNLAVVELEPSSVVPEHSHENEQLGIVLRGSLSFRVGDEVRDLAAGATYRIAPNVPHEVLGAGPEGAVVIDVFAPVRADWAGLERIGVRQPAWP
jgi:unsaturated pyranuronate lyase